MVLDGKILGQRRRYRPRMKFIKHTDTAVSIQTYLELNRAAGDRSQWKGIIRMHMTQHGADIT